MKEIFTKERFNRFAGRKAADRFFPHMYETLEKYGIDTPLRICHFLGQVAHESGNFIYVRELASGQAYNPPSRIATNLGNTQAGDGPLFRGRGLIQITGRFNYTQISKDLGEDFVRNPSLLEDDRWACVSAGWYWNRNKLNAIADRDDLNALTRRINGGTNGLQDRIDKTNRARNIFI